MTWTRLLSWKHLTDVHQKLVFEMGKKRCRARVTGNRYNRNQRKDGRKEKRKEGVLCSIHIYFSDLWLCHYLYMCYMYMRPMKFDNIFWETQAFWKTIITMIPTEQSQPYMCPVHWVCLMYQSNRSLNIPLPPPPRGIPWAFDVFSCPGGREFD